MKWISVKDQLPQKGKEVFIASFIENIEDIKVKPYYMYFVGSYISHNNFASDFCDDHFEGSEEYEKFQNSITHWAEIEPPKDE